MAIISLKGLQKSFRIGFFMKEVVAVRDSTFDVMEGEAFGIVGANGAGKTTTIKMLMGLIRPDAGSATIDGISIREREARARVAYLPETPNFYDYLKPAELLDYFGDLYGMDRSEKKKRIPLLIERVGLTAAVDKPLRKFSKGMLQRIGLAQALLPDSRIIILDEPQSGLDPLGRKDVRDLILEEKGKGKTIMMCSHVLHDVESVCDRIAILHAGRVTRVGDLATLLKSVSSSIEVGIRLDDAEALGQMTTIGGEFVERTDGTKMFTVSDSAKSNELVKRTLDAGGIIEQVIPHRGSLEDLFTQEALRTDSPEDDR
ncbi:MAG: ABC-2 type transport system ATP-binding protein [Bradymonadia bacterium]|jgi:ABC-2 type transport system ATP-binding protein